MLRHYVRLIGRNLIKQKIYALINIGGLAISIACALLLFLFVRFETSFDSFHDNSNRLYRAWIHEDHGSGREFTDITTPFILAPTLKQNVPEIEETVRIWDASTAVRFGDNTFDERLHLVDPAFLDIFSFTWLAGDKATALASPDGIVVTPELAGRYFGADDPLGQQLEVLINGEYRNYTVKGLIESPPLNSSIQYQVLMQLDESEFPENMLTSWFQISPETYVMLRLGADSGELENGFEALMRRILGDAYPAGHYQINLQPITAIHLDNSLPAGMEPVENPVYSWIAGISGFLILVVATVNFVTLATGCSAGRTTEVGMRKVMGARRLQIARQFYVENTFSTLIAVIVGYALAELALPSFNALTGNSLILALDFPMLAGLLGLVLVAGFVAALYPTLALAGSFPARVLRNKSWLPGSRQLVRDALITFQFTVVVIMIVSTVVVARQYTLLQESDLGYVPDDVLVLSLNSTDNAGSKATLLINEINSLPFVEDITSAAYSPVDEPVVVGFEDDAGLFREFHANVVNANYLSAMGMELIAGRDFSVDIATDNAQAIIVNEAFVDHFGWEQPLGQRLPSRAFPEHEVVGVVKNFNFMPLEQEIMPLMLVMDLEPFYSGLSDATARTSSRPDILIRLQEENLPVALNGLEAVWDELIPDNGFEPQFLEEALGAQYQTQAQLNDIIRLATLLTLLIACLGLLGVAKLVTEYRVKEIGIRKVLGSTVMQVVLLLTNNFSKLVLISNIIAWPVAFFAMNRWLANFAYRIDLTPLIFIGSGLIALCIAWVTVGGTAAKAASRKPVLALRYE